jgi:transposase InsO family protein
MWGSSSLNSNDPSMFTCCHTTGPNKVWGCYITKIKGPVRWSYYHLYVILNIFSRYVVGWMIALR